MSEGEGGRTIYFCSDCDERLTDEERRFYENRCEQCERDRCDRWQAWRHGADDPELDRLFSAPKPTVQ